MSIDMYLGPSDQQAQSVKRMVATHKKGYDQLVEAINAFGLSGPSLSGQTYDSARGYFLSVLMPLAKGGQLLSEKVAEATKKLPDGYRSEVDSCDLKESELEEKIQQLKDVIEQKKAENQALRMLMIGLTSEEAAPLRAAQRSNTRMMQTTSEALRKVQEKLEKLLAYNAKSATLFSEIESLRHAVATGQKLTATAWTGNGFRSFSKRDMAWASEINGQWAEKEWKERLNKAEERYAENGYLIGVYVDGKLDKELTQLYRAKIKTGKKAFWSGFLNQLMNNNGKDLLNELFDRDTQFGSQYSGHQSYYYGQLLGNFTSLFQGGLEILGGSAIIGFGDAGSVLLSPESGGASLGAIPVINAEGTAWIAHGSGVMASAISGLGSGGSSFGGDKTITDYSPEELSNMTLEELKELVPEDWEFLNNNGRVHIKDSNGDYVIRIDPPDSGTNYQHMHIYDSNQNPLDAYGNVVHYKDEAAHIPWSFYVDPTIK